MVTKYHFYFFSLITVGLLSFWPVGFQFSAQQPLQAINYDDIMLERIYFETLTHMHHVYVHWKNHVEFSILSNKTIAAGSEQKKWCASRFQVLQLETSKLYNINCYAVRLGTFQSRYNNFSIRKVKTKQNFLSITR